MTDTSNTSSITFTHSPNGGNKSQARTRFRRLSSMVLLAAGLGFVPATQSAAAPPPQGPVLGCQNSVCVINPYGTDSDGDGFSDADEIMAGTDPYDASSRPIIRDLVEIWLKGVDTGRDIPFREVIVLPETTPDGKSIGRNPSAELPGRKDMMEQLGLTNSMLGDIDTGQGIGAMINLGAAINGGGKNGAPPVRTNGMDVSLISGYEGTTTKTPTGEKTEWRDKETGKYKGYDETSKNPDGSTDYTSCNSDGTCKTIHEEAKPSEYVNPDYSGEEFTPAPFGQVIVATPAQIAAFNLKRGTNTNIKDTGVAPDGSTPPYLGGSNGNPTIILVNPEDDTVLMSKEITAGVPINPNIWGGNVNGGRPDGPNKPGCGLNPALPC